MKRSLAFALILPLVFPAGLALHVSPAVGWEISGDSGPIFVAERGGGNRGGGNRAERGGGNRGSRNIDRSQVGARGSGRVERDRSANRDRNINRDQAGERANNVDRNQARERANNVDRNQARERVNNVDRNQAGERANNVDRAGLNNRVNNIDRDRVQNRVDNRDFNFDNDRNFSNRVNRNIINTGDRNVIVNPRGWGGWGWNGGVAWAPNYSYWGGGFWGGFAVGALATGITTAIVNAANQPNYVVIERGSPGYTLFESYGLTQIQCVDNGSLVYIYGPQDSLICANPNSLVRAGYYDIDPETLVLIAR
jgi:hypothetical protein